MRQSVKSCPEKVVIRSEVPIPEDSWSRSIVGVGIKCAATVSQYEKEI